MTFAKLLAELQGDRTQQEFGDRLGISQQVVSVITLGNHQAGRKVLAALVDAFPAREDDLVKAFLAQEAA